jgi:dGTP triphosphohydrolase
MTKEYIVNTSNTRKVIDYIAGMTDDYMINEYNKIKESNN